MYDRILYGVMFDGKPDTDIPPYVYNDEETAKRLMKQWNTGTDDSGKTAADQYGPARVTRVHVTELPDDYDDDQERTMERIKTADEIESTNSYLDHPALS